VKTKLDFVLAQLARISREVPINRDWGYLEAASIPPPSRWNSIASSMWSNCYWPAAFPIRILAKASRSATRKDLRTLSPAWLIPMSKLWQPRKCS